VNRVASVSEGTIWAQTYGYDAYGNSCFLPSNIPNVPSPPLNVNAPTSCSLYNAKNQRTDQTYDATGNLTALQPAGNGITYDAENRQLSVGPNTYDGDGRRVMKLSGGVTTVFIYDAMGQRRKWILDLTAEVKEAKRLYAEPGRSHQHAGRCLACGFRDGCSEAL
jgi:hypothetical protein